MKFVADHRAWSGCIFTVSLAGFILAACSGDDQSPATASGSGGQTSNGTGGKVSVGTGGRMSVATGGRGAGGTHASGGTAGTGGRGSGGQGGVGGTGGRSSGGTDGGPGGTDGGDGGIVDADAGCPPPLILTYRYPGCGAAAKPVCLGPNNEGGFWTACLCDGTTIQDAGWPMQPYAHYGACESGVPGDASTD